MLQSNDFGKPGYEHRNLQSMNLVSSDVVFGTAPGLKASFRSAVSGSAAPEPDRQNNRTLLADLAPQLETKVNTSKLDGYAIDKTKNSESVSKMALATENQPRVKAIGVEIHDTKAAITQTIEQAQAEVIASLKELNQAGILDISAQEMFPGSVAGRGSDTTAAFSMAVGAAVGGVSGAGSLVTAQQAMTDLRTIYSGMSGVKNPAQAEAMLRDYMAMKQGREEAAPMATPSFAVASQSEKPQQSQKSPINWVNFAKSDHSLKELMELDPKKPNEKIVPEMAELNEQEHKFQVADRSVQDVLDGKALTGDMGEATAAAKRGDLETVKQAVPEIDVGDGFTSRGILETIRLAKVDPLLMSNISLMQASLNSSLKTPTPVNGMEYKPQAPGSTA